jgi:hypothetical protein
VAGVRDPAEEAQAPFGIPWVSGQHDTRGHVGRNHLQPAAAVDVEEADVGDEGSGRGRRLRTRRRSRERADERASNKSPLVATETTIPGRVSAPTSLLM